MTVLSSADRWTDLNARPTQSSFVVTAVHQDPISVSWINGEVCHALLTSRQRYTGDTAALAAVLDIKTPMEIQYEMTEKGGSLRWQLDWALEHKKASATSCHLEAAETSLERVLHETPDAGCGGEDCGEALDATDGIAANGPREDRGGTYPLDVLASAPSYFARPAAHLGQNNLAQRFGDDSSPNLRVYEETMEEQTNAAAESENPWSHGAKMATHRERFGTHRTRKKQRTTSRMHQTISKQSQLGGPTGIRSRFPRY